MKCLKITNSDGSGITLEISKSKKEMPLYGEVIEKPEHFIYAAYSGYYFIDKKTMQGVFDDGRISKSKFEIVKGAF